MIPFPLPSLNTLVYGALAIVVALGVGYVKGCSDEEERGAAFKAAVKAVGDAQEERTRLRIKEDKQRKEKADVENRKLHRDLDVATKRLRDERSRRSYVPAPAPGSRDPERAAFDRAELDSAIRRFVEEAAGLVEQGDQARIDLDSVKLWAQER